MNRCLWLLAVLVIADLGTKLLTVWLLEPGARIVVVPGFFNLVHVINPGAAWGILAGRKWLLIAISLVVAAVIALFHRHIAEGWKERYYALALVGSGVVGNTADRFWREGVVDFLDFHIGQRHWPAFNVADSAITIGVGIIIVSSLLRQPPKPKIAAAASDETPNGK